MSLIINYPENSISTTDSLIPLSFQASGIKIPVVPSNFNTTGTIGIINSSPIPPLVLPDDSTLNFNGNLHFYNYKWNTVIDKSVVQYVKNTTTQYINNQKQSYQDRIASISAGNPIRKGIICMWSGAEIPEKWALCDGSVYGSLTTPDLRDRFLYGNPYPDISTFQYQGLNAVTVTESTMPSHYHVVPYGTREKISGWFYSGAEGYGKSVYNQITNARWRLSEPVGGGKPHNNMPPFYSLAFIIYIGDEI